MSKKLLTGLISALMCVSLMAGCGANTANTDTADETAAEETAEATEETSKKSSDKISVKNLTEKSEPVGVSELDAGIVYPTNSDGTVWDEPLMYVSGKLTNNNSEYDETVITVSLEIQDSDGVKICSQTVVSDSLEEGDSYSFNEEPYYYSDVDDDEELTVKVTSIEIEDGAIAEKREAFEDAVDDLDTELRHGNYNQAQLMWENIQEEYGEDFASEIKVLEA
ncbi:MAG: hypothetical protein LUD03_05570 [Firmicutes bacterium]|nr:hypothetical protein [Bacillota bacterium]